MHKEGENRNNMLKPRIWKLRKIKGEFEGERYPLTLVRL
jgi:hypothetical protein